MRILTIIALIVVACVNTTLASDENNEAKSTDNELAKIAAAYLNHLAKATLDLAEHTALSKHCGQERIDELYEQIDFFRENHVHENDRLSIEAQKTEGHLAGVLIRAQNDTSPLDIRIHTIALIKKEDSWLPAPLPGKFTNTGYGFDEKIEQSTRTLERWMAREKVLRESQYREQARDGINSKLVSMAKEAGFDKMSPHQAAELLVEQCRNHNLMGIIASLGGGSDALNQRIGDTMDLVSEGLKQKGNHDSEWFLLTNRSVIAQVLEFDQKRGGVAVGFYDPAQERRWNATKVIRFPIHIKNGGTFIQLPPSLQATALSEGDVRKHRIHRAQDRKLRAKIPTSIFKNVAVLHHETPEKLLEYFLDTLEKKDFTPWVKLTPRKGSFFGNEENHEKILSELATLWRNMDWMVAAKLHSQPVIKEKHLALAPILYEKVSEAGVFHTTKVWMLKDEDGWHLISPLTLYSATKNEDHASIDKIEGLLAASEEKRREEQERNLLSKLVTITSSLDNDSTTQKDAASVFATFRNHLRSRDTQPALSHCAILKGTNDAQALKALNYALRGASDHTDQDLILGTTRKGNWTGISVRTESKLAEAHDYPLYLIANTEEGLRILIDVDLRHPSNKGRTLLNKKNWSKCEEILPMESIDDLKAIFEEHLKLSAKDIDQASKARE